MDSNVRKISSSVALAIAMGDLLDPLDFEPFPTGNFGEALALDTFSKSDLGGALASSTLSLGRYCRASRSASLTSGDFRLSATRKDFWLGKTVSLFRLDATTLLTGRMEACFFNRTREDGIGGPRSVVFLTAESWKLISDGLAKREDITYIPYSI